MTGVDPRGAAPPGGALVEFPRDATSSATARARGRAASTVAARPELVADLALLAVTAVWGTSFALQKIATREMGAAIFNACRFAVAVLVLVPVFWAQLRRADRRDLATAGVVGLVLGAAMMLQSAGLVRTSASVGGFISGLPVVMTPLLAIPFLHERAGPLTIAAVLLATLGLGLISLSDTVNAAPGDLLVLVSSVGFALQIVFTGRLAGRMDPRALGTMEAVGALVACAAATTMLDRVPAALSAYAIAKRFSRAP